MWLASLLAYASIDSLTSDSMFIDQLPLLLSTGAVPSIGSYLKTR